MSDQEQERPLTRRELRLRQQAEATAVQQQDDVSEIPAPVVHESDDLSAAEALVAEIEISPFNEDGTPRSRREIRELREAAIAELLGASSAEADSDVADSAAPGSASPDRAQPATETAPTEADDAASDEDDEAAGEAEEQDQVAAEVDDEPLPIVPDEAAPNEDDLQHAEGAEDHSYGAPTEAFTLDDLRDAEAAADEHTIEPEPTEPLSLEDLFEVDESEEVEEPAGNADSVAALFGDDEEPADEGGSESGLPETPIFESADGDAHETDKQSVDPNSDAELDAGREDDRAGSDQKAETDAGTGDEREAESEGYSFPDIQPPEEWRSVFDDPSRGPASADEPTGDFDDLISRAVAQEGSTGSTGASALILPSHPEDTGGIAGPLGSTGELFVTGSIELPKSLGETGGHAAIHDSIELEPFLTGEQPGAISQPQAGGPTPVSALSAVSARRRPEIPVVAEPTKDRSKLPIILALTGGGLLVLLAGAAVYAASQGLFG